VFAFVGSFYACLVGAKILVAVLVSRSREFVTGSGYRLVMRTLGVALCGLAVWMLVTGVAGVMDAGVSRNA
jgi:small neutral amino acid transporter SnatA (MarC family)